MTYRTLHTLKTIVIMVVISVIVVVGLLNFQNKMLKKDELAQINISAETKKLENGNLYLPLLFGNTKVSEIVQKKNQQFINFVNNGELHSVNHKVTFVNNELISIVWEGTYKGTANDIDGDNKDVSYKVMDSVVIDLQKKEAMSISEIAKWVIKNRYVDEDKNLNLNKIKDKSFDMYQNAYIENGEDKFPNIVLFWRNNLDLMKYNKQKMTGEDLLKNLK